MPATKQNRRTTRVREYTWLSSAPWRGWRRSVATQPPHTSRSSTPQRRAAGRALARACTAMIAEAHPLDADDAHPPTSAPPIVLALRPAQSAAFPPPQCSVQYAVLSRGASVAGSLPARARLAAPQLTTGRRGRRDRVHIDHHFASAQPCHETTPRFLALALSDAGADGFAEHVAVRIWLSR